jgi:hypothetical protein
MAAPRKHGMFGTKIYGSWGSMIQRCTDTNHPYFKNYGGKGVTVCDKWRNFEGFYEDMKDGHADDLMLDRKENDKGYYKENCRWASRKEQANNMTTNRIINVDGKDMTLAQACELLNINYTLVRMRIHRGRTEHEALYTPVSKNRDSSGRFERCKLSV